MDLERGRFFFAIDFFRRLFRAFLACAFRRDFLTRFFFAFRFAETAEPFSEAQARAGPFGALVPNANRKATKLVSSIRRPEYLLAEQARGRSLSKLAIGRNSASIEPRARPPDARLSATPSRIKVCMGCSSVVRPDEGRLAERVLEVLRPYVSEARQRRMTEVLHARTREVTVVLEDVMNDHNGAAVMRTADALGLMEIHVVTGPEGFRASRKVARGSQRWVEVIRHDSVEAAYAALRGRGYKIWAATVHGQSFVPVNDIPREQRVALVFGNELDGLSDSAQGEADARFRVPMHGFVESLNISVAAALALSAVVEPRRQAGTLAPLDADERLCIEARWYRQSVRASAQLLARAGLPTFDDEPSDVELVEGDRETARTR